MKKKKRKHNSKDNRKVEKSKKQRKRAVMDDDDDDEYDDNMCPEDADTQDNPKVKHLAVKNNPNTKPMAVGADGKKNNPKPLAVVGDDKKNNPNTKPLAVVGDEMKNNPKKKPLAAVGDDMKNNPTTKPIDGSSCASAPSTCQPTIATPTSGVVTPVALDENVSSQCGTGVMVQHSGVGSGLTTPPVNRAANAMPGPDGFKPAGGNGDETNIGLKYVLAFIPNIGGQRRVTCSKSCAHGEINA